MTKWGIEELTDYKPLTDYWDVFTIAEGHGVDEIKDAYKKVFNECKTDYKYLTELVMVLNWKMWEHSESNYMLGHTYSKLWEMADLYAGKYLKEDELRYFYRTTD